MRLVLLPPAPPILSHAQAARRAPRERAAPQRPQAKRESSRPDRKRKHPREALTVRVRSGAQSKLRRPPRSYGGGFMALIATARSTAEPINETTARRNWRSLLRARDRRGGTNGSLDPTRGRRSNRSACGWRGDVERVRDRCMGVWGALAPQVTEPPLPELRTNPPKQPEEEPPPRVGDPNLQTLNQNAARTPNTNHPR